jgi:acetyl esterase/lipase
VYDAALSMYDSLLPLVRDHLACAGPGAKVAFTGHSLGGSLATVITLLMIHRCGARTDFASALATAGAEAGADLGCR